MPIVKVECACVRVCARTSTYTSVHAHTVFTPPINVMNEEARVWKKL